MLDQGEATSQKGESFGKYIIIEALLIFIIWEDKLGLFYGEAGDIPDWNVGFCPMKEGREEFLMQGFLNRHEVPPHNLVGTLERVPLLPERILYPCVCGLYMTSRHPHQHI